jgi:hypothetical protein
LFSGNVRIVPFRTYTTTMMDGTDRIVVHDVVILAENEHVVICRVHGKVVSLARLRLLPGSVISEPGGYGTLVVARAFAGNLGLVFRDLACGSVAESQEHMPHRRCEDCGTFLRNGDGWIVPPDYPRMDTSPGARDTVPLCNLCLLTRCRGARGRTISSDT